MPARLARAPAVDLGGGAPQGYRAPAPCHLLMPFIGSPELQGPVHEARATSALKPVGSTTEWLEEVETAAAAAVIMTATAAAASPVHTTNLGMGERHADVPPVSGTPVPPWFGPTGGKFNTAEWQRHGCDSAAIRNVADWLIFSTPKVLHRLKNYLSLLAHQDETAEYFDALVMVGVRKQYDLTVHSFESNFAAVNNPLHFEVKAGESLCPVINPSRSCVISCMRKLPCLLPHLVTILEYLPVNGFLCKRDLASGFRHVKSADSDR